MVGESTVRRYVREVKAELAAAGWKVAVPQTHGLGEEAETDFGEFYGWLAGDWTRLWLFVMRLSASGRAFHWVFGNQTGESFYEGHNRAFAHFGGVPGRIRYDNLRPAVIRVLLGRQRWENPKFAALRSHYGFDSFYCLPGPDGAHEKGGVEGEIGRFRRRWLVPVPAAGSLDDLNQMVTEADLTEDARVVSGRPPIDGRHLTVGQHFVLERPHLGTLPVDVFDVAVVLECRVDHKARICVRQAFYSVPARLAGRKVTVRLGAGHLEILDQNKTLARHVRSRHKGTETLTLDHYLEILVPKPGALMGATALVQARASGGFTEAHQRFWDAARRRLGDQRGHPGPDWGAVGASASPPRIGRRRLGSGQPGGNHRPGRGRGGSSPSGRHPAPGRRDPDRRLGPLRPGRPLGGGLRPAAHSTTPMTKLRPPPCASPPSEPKPQPGRRRRPRPTDPSWLSG